MRHANAIKLLLALLVAALFPSAAGGKAPGALRQDLDRAELSAQVDAGPDARDAARAPDAIRTAPPDSPVLLSVGALRPVRAGPALPVRGLATARPARPPAIHVFQGLSPP
jgi:hypothetical protein